jgi:hypothetical protein
MMPWLCWLRSTRNRPKPNKRLVAFWPTLGALPHKGSWSWTITSDVTLDIKPGVPCLLLSFCIDATAPFSAVQNAPQSNLVGKLLYTVLECSYSSSLFEEFTLSKFTRIPCEPSSLYPLPCRTFVSTERRALPAREGMLAMPLS